MAVALALGACSSGSSKAGPATTSGASTSAPTVAGASTTTPAQTSGTRTVLSPLGLNIREQPSKAAKVLGTVARGTTLTVLGHTADGGGFYQVKGATVTGWVTDGPAYTSSGKFMAYGSDDHQFSALYLDTWTVTEAPPTSVVFRPPSGGDSIVVTTAATVALLGRGRTGYQQRHSETAVVCGITADLITYEAGGTSTGTSTTTGASAPPGGATGERFLAQVHLTLDPMHALGIDANLADSASLPEVRDLINSVKFPFPQCEQ